jgi:N-formylglutamate deformylase
MSEPAWLSVTRGDAPLLLSLPHTGTELGPIEPRLVSPWLARKDADWWIDRLYDFADDLGATIVRTAMSRTIIDVNRDPSGVSLYPGQATTELCPTTTFDGEPLYREGQAPSPDEIAERRATWFDPYHATLTAEIARLRTRHPNIVLYDCHSIRSEIPRLFQGELPVFNLGTNGGVSADPEISDAVAHIMMSSGQPSIVNGRFKGGWITRAYGDPKGGVHALQMELACRGYMRDPDEVGPDNWPAPYEPEFAQEMRRLLTTILETALRRIRART